MGVFNVQRCKILIGGGKGEPRFPLNCWVIFPVQILTYFTPYLILF